jgi:hypothetical protein
VKLPALVHGSPADALSFPRVLLAGILYSIALGALGYVFDVAVGPLIGMWGWWNVAWFGGLILGITRQCVREYARPVPS